MVPHTHQGNGKSSCNCPMETCMSHIGKKWSVNILRDLFSGRKRFKDFMDANPDLSTKMLSARLKELEKDKFIEKKIISTTPLLAEYALTDKGRALNRILYELSAFSMQYCCDELGKMNVQQKEKALGEVRRMLGLEKELVELRH
jgi:DNA-binding HxlR family transcriptional regulator